MSTQTQPQQTALNASIQTGRLKFFVNVLTTIVDEAKLTIDSDGLHVTAVDAANVGMIEVDLEAEAFESYQANEELVAMELSPHVDFLGMHKDSTVTDITVDIDNGKVTLTNNGYSRTESLLDPDSVRKEPDIPDIRDSLTGEALLETDEFSRAITAVDQVGDHATIWMESGERSFNLTAEGDTNDADINLKGDQLIDCSPGDAHSMFSCDYLKKIKKGLPKGGEVLIEVGAEFPLVVEFDKTFESNQGEAAVHTEFSLAPRIEEEE